MINITVFGSDFCPNCTKVKDICAKALNDGYIDSFDYKDATIPENALEGSKILGKQLSKIPLIVVNGKITQYSTLCDMLS